MMLKPMFRFLLAGLFLAGVAAYAQLKDYRGFKDPQLFSRVPKYFLSEGGAFVEAQFDGHAFRAAKGDDTRVEGHFMKFGYTFDETRGAPASQLQIIRNYQNATLKIGGKVLYDSSDRTTLFISKNGKETWADVEAFGNSYSLIIVERDVMKQDVVADAAAMQSGLAQDGHVEVPGIYFDTAKSEVKPESAAALKELVKLLRGNQGMRVWVVGNTDSVGLADANVGLSNARAAAVIRSLVQMGIEGKRLAPHGAGPFSPVATNRTEQGRARNRRVELVEQP
jgi:outer membrane protein OmpA-like peptidoglycan-associated protein